MSPRQVSSEYRNQEQRTLIGFGIFYKDSDNNLDCLNVDLISKKQRKAVLTRSMLLGNFI